MSGTDLAHRLEAIVRSGPVLMAALRAARSLDLPDAWIVSGAIYNRVWNALCDLPEMHGVKDIDLFYWHADTSWAAEDAVIRRARGLFPAPPAPPVEIRNQARVHLWYEAHFGMPCAAIPDSRAAIARFASRTHCVALRLEDDDSLTLHAPFGLEDIFAMRLVPNPVTDNRRTHAEKAARQKAIWPQLEVVAWPG